MIALDTISKVSSVSDKESEFFFIKAPYMNVELLHINQF